MRTRPQHDRFKDAPWFPKEDINVIVGGAGGIGSWTTLLLARAGFQPLVYDFDVLEEHNMGGQLYPKGLVGKPKVEALQIICRDFAQEELMIFNEVIDENTPSHFYCISAFDNMKARKAMFDSWSSLIAPENPQAIFIDGRLTAEQMQIFCVTPSRIEEYRKHLFDDSEVEDAPCTMKQTSHAAAMIAAHIVGFFTNHITNVVENDTTRTIPFKWEYFIPMDLLDVQYE